MSYRSLSGYIACLLVLLVVVFVEKGLIRKAKQTTVETYKSEYVLPEDVDTVRINTASVLELKHIGFTNYEIVSIMSSRERGFVFRNLSQLKSGHYFDTLKIDIMAPYLVFDTLAFVRPSRNVSYANKPKYTFDPKISLYYAEELELKRYGLADAVVDTILQYRDEYYLKGSIVLSELKRATPQTIGTLLSSHITRKKKRPEHRLSIKVELNTATSEQLVTLPWVKEKTAGIILRYREKLGGFVDVSQLLEVFGIDSVRFAAIKPNVYVDTTKITRIMINKRISRDYYHPYLTKELKHSLEMNRHLNEVNSIDEFRVLYEDKYKSKWLEKYLSFEK
jgi:DNA uptake protein ComE-like DNA-binding protein